MNGTDATINKNDKVIKIITIDSQAAMILALLGSALAMPQSALSARGCTQFSHGGSHGGHGHQQNPCKKVIKHTDKVLPNGEHIHEHTETIYYDYV